MGSRHRSLVGVRVGLDFVELGKGRTGEGQRVRAFVLQEGGEVREVVEPGVACLVTDRPQPTQRPTVLAAEAIRCRIPVLSPNDFYAWAKSLLAFQQAHALGPAHAPMGYAMGGHGAAGPSPYYAAPPPAPAKASATSLANDFPHPHWLKYQDMEGRYAPLTASWAQWPGWRVARRPLGSQPQTEPSADETSGAKDSSDLVVLEHYESDKAAFCYICAEEMPSVEALNAHELSQRHLNSLKAQYAEFDRLIPPTPFPRPADANGDATASEETEAASSTAPAAAALSPIHIHLDSSTDNSAVDPLLPPPPPEASQPVAGPCATSSPILPPSDTQRQGPSVTRARDKDGGKRKEVEGPPLGMGKETEAEKRKKQKEWRKARLLEKMEDRHLAKKCDMLTHQAELMELRETLARQKVPDAKLQREREAEVGRREAVKVLTKQTRLWAVASRRRRLHKAELRALRNARVPRCPSPFVFRLRRPKASPPSAPISS